MNYKLLVLLSFILLSCDGLFNPKFDREICTSNCYRINAKGWIVNKSTNSSLSGIPVTFCWLDPGRFVGSEKIIDKKKTNSDGYFSFNNKVDVSNFSDGYNLKIYIPEYEDYYTYPDYGYSLNSIDDTRLSQLNFNFFNKTDLNLVFERVESDSFQSFYVEHYFYMDDAHTYSLGYLFDYSITMDEIEENATILKNTAAGVYTYIMKTKRYEDGKTVYILDSTICEDGIVNEYIVEY